MGDRFFRLDADFPWHPKTLNIEGILSYPGAGGFVVNLWAWAALYRPGGDLTGMDSSQISAAARWPGDPDTFVEALKTCGDSRAGFLEEANGRLVLHDWLEKQKYFADAEKREKERIRKHVQRMSHPGPGPTPDNDGEKSQECPARDKRRDRSEGDERSDQPPSIPPRGDDGFDKFWQLYPKRVGKKAALRIWQRLKPDAQMRARICNALRSQARWEAWQRENGRFIPNPTTWLNQGRWDDEEPPTTQAEFPGTERFKEFMEGSS